MACHRCRDKTGNTFQDPRVFGIFKLRASPDTRLFVTVVAAGALGSLIHCITSFADYVGDRSLKQSWVWYLILSTPIGIALALLVYLVTSGSQSSWTPRTCRPKAYCR